MCKFEGGLWRIRYSNSVSVEDKYPQMQQVVELAWDGVKDRWVAANHMRLLFGSQFVP